MNVTSSGQSFEARDLVPNCCEHKIDSYAYSYDYSSPPMTREVILDRLLNRKIMFYAIHNATKHDFMTKTEYFFRAFLFYPYAPHFYYNLKELKWCRYPAKFQGKLDEKKFMNWCEHYIWQCGSQYIRKKYGDDLDGHHQWQVLNRNIPGNFKTGYHIRKGYKKLCNASGKCVEPAFLLFLGVITYAGTFYAIKNGPLENISIKRHRIGCIGLIASCIWHLWMCKEFYDRNSRLNAKIAKEKLDEEQVPVARSSDTASILKYSHQK